MSERTVAEYPNCKLTGEAAMEYYAMQEGRTIESLGDGTYRFVDGVKTYKPVMVAKGWRIVCVKETE
jgi:hypothetical protein